MEPDSTSRRTAVEVKLQEVINKLDHLISLSNDIEQLLITRHELRLAGTRANGGEASVASELAATAAVEPAAASEAATP
jgi:hypothetical protein